MKKLKLIILSLMMLVCGRSISQTVTQKESHPQQNKVVIDTTIARFIAVDLVKGDVCKEEIKLVRSNLFLTKKEVVLKDSIISTLGKQKDGLNLIISKKDEMFSKQEEISNTFKKQLSKQKGNTFIVKALLVVSIIGNAILIIKP
jgi:hypothetical protein